MTLVKPSRRRLNHDQCSYWSSCNSSTNKKRYVVRRSPLFNSCSWNKSSYIRPNPSLSLPETDKARLNTLSRGLILRIWEHNRRVRSGVPGETSLALSAVAAFEHEHLVWRHLMDVVPRVLLLLLRVCQERVRDVWIPGLTEPPVVHAQSRRVAECKGVTLQRFERLPYLPKTSSQRVVQE